MSLTTGYRTAALSSNPAVSWLIDSAPRLLGLPVLVNLPAFLIVIRHLVAAARPRESTTANNVLVVLKLLRWGSSSPSGCAA